MVTLSLIQDADIDAVVSSLTSCKTIADNWTAVAALYQMSVGSPAGQEWTGRTAQAALALASSDRSAMDACCAGVGSLVATAIQGIDDALRADLAEVRRLISDAVASGFTVNEDLSVSYGDPAPSQTAQADAERQARLIQAAARKWWKAEQTVANGIVTSYQDLAVEFKKIAGAIDYRGDAVTFYSSVMSTLGLQLRIEATPARVHAPRALPYEILNPHQYGKHATDIARGRSHVKLPINAAAMSRAGRILGPIGVVAGVGYEAYGDLDAYRNHQMTAPQAFGKFSGAVGGGVLGGMAGGALAGSVFGPVGTAIGAGIGAVVGSEIFGPIGKGIGGLFSH